MIVATFAFWISVFVVFYAYAGYPMLVVLVGALRRRRVHTQSITPTLSLIIAAYNEEREIAERLDSLLLLDYPKDALQIIVASDGSDDGTEDVVKAHADQGVELLRLPRRGKNATLNSAVLHATGEILVFSDANIMFPQDTLRKTARNFADPTVGGVAGVKVYTLDEEGSDAGSLGENMYWRYDCWLRKMESYTGTMVSSDGALHAVRRRLFRELPPGSGADDFGISAAVVEQGFRLVYEGEARAYEAAMPASDRQFHRKIRVIICGLQALSFRTALFNPFRFGFYSVALFSHKVLRRLVPFFLITLFGASVALYSHSPFFSFITLAQVMCYLLAILGFCLRSKPFGRAKVFYVPFYYCMVNAAALIAIVKFAMGSRIELWQPQRHGTGT